jgi:D-aspartate ligase
MTEVGKAMRLVETDQEIAANFDRSVAVLVLNFGDYPFMHGTLGIIRSLGRLGIPVFAIQRCPTLPIGASRYLAGKCLWSIDGKNTDEFLQGMAKISKVLDRPTILVAGDDLSAILMAEHARELEPQFKFVRQPEKLPRTLANKQYLYGLCQQLGVPFPATVFPQTREELLAVSGQIQYPVVVKVAEPWLLPKGFRSVAIVPEPSDLIEYYDRFAQQSPATSLMIQELISDEGAEDWFVHGYCDGKSTPVVLFTGIKLRSYPAFAGPTTMARAVHNDTLQRQVIKLIRDIGYAGILDLDWRLDGRGRYNLLDFNPRVGAQFPLFRTETGMDVVRMLHLDLTGRALRGGQQVEGRTFMLDVQDVIASYRYYRSGRLTVRDWKHSFWDIDERAWYAADDPRPFWQMSRSLILRALTRTFGLNDSTTRGYSQPEIQLCMKAPSAGGQLKNASAPSQQRTADALENG